ncbi:speedy protein E4-like [Thomomys bottae]
MLVTFQPSSQCENQSPQPSGYSSDVVMEEDVPESSAMWTDSRPLAQSCSLKKKRDWSSDSESEEEPDEELVQEKEMAARPVWCVEKLGGLKMKFKRRRRSLVLPVHHKVFAKLLEDPVVRRFLAWDKKLRVSDKYLLAMVIAYFSRAGLFSWQFRRIHFFLALYLASDMEEDNQAPKQDIFHFLYGKSYAERPSFHRLRYQWIRSMGWNVRVSREECEEIQGYDPELWVWGRDRDHLP